MAEQYDNIINEHLQKLGMTEYKMVTTDNNEHKLVKVGNIHTVAEGVNTMRNTPGSNPEAIIPGNMSGSNTSRNKPKSNTAGGNPSRNSPMNNSTSNSSSNNSSMSSLTNNSPGGNPSATTPSADDEIKAPRKLAANDHTKPKHHKNNKHNKHSSESQQSEPKKTLLYQRPPRESNNIIRGRNARIVDMATIDEQGKIKNKIIIRTIN